MNDDYEVVFIDKNDFFNDPRVFEKYKDLFENYVDVIPTNTFVERFNCIKQGINECSDNIILCLMKDAVWVAMAVILIEDRVHLCKLDEIVVRESQRDKGIGTIFFGMIETIIKKKDIDQILVHTLLSFPNVKYFYCKLGFKKIDELPLEENDDPSMERFSVLVKELAK